MTTQRTASPTESPTPLKVDVLQLMFFLLGAPHIYGALRANDKTQRGFTFPAYSYLIPLAAVIAGGVEFWLL
jgi:hypothetical protein